MMSQELMIGNWIDSGHGVVCVTGLTSDNVLSITTTPNMVGTCSGSIYSGILITPQWLGNFGFGCDFGEWYLKISDDDYLWLHKGEWYLGETRPDFKVQFSLKHVHELQNFYFGLTGKHLTIDP